ncbi:MAG: NAD(P)/FAD-dependent oxidoreductase [Chloroflexota bacterium]
MKVGIIGAGFIGLTAALDLAKAGHQVTIFEANAYPGGLGGGFKAPHWDWTVEHFYHHWFTSDTHISGLIDEIGQRDNLFFPTPITSLYLEDAVYPLTPPMQKMLLFPKLRFIPKMRFGFVGLYLKFTKNWQALEKETTHNWLSKTMGEEAYRVMWEPLLIGKFGNYYKQVNMAWMWARIHVRSVDLGYFRGGFQVFADRLCEYIQQQGVDVRLETKISKITQGDDKQLIVETGDNALTFDRVIAAGPSPKALPKLVPDLPSSYLSSLEPLNHMGAVVMVLALDRALTDEHYWINLPVNEGFPYVALVEHTNFISSEHYGGDHVIYCGHYVEPDHDYFSMSKEELLEIFLPTLTRFNADFKPDWVKDSWLFREKYAQPVPLVNHSKNIPSLETPIPGLYWASMSHVYPWDRGTNFAVGLGHDVADLVMKQGAT